MNNIAVFVYLLLNEDAERNQMRIERKILRDALNPFEFPDHKFLKDFRLSRDIIINLIHQIRPFANISNRSDAIPFEMRVLATINFLSNGSDQTCIGNSAWTNMSQSSISKSLNEICRLITTHLSNTWITFPRHGNEKMALKEGFYDKWRMRGIIGAIDGTHVKIISPPITDEEHVPNLYINRKGKHSINVMLICDSNSKILALNARYPGSVHDAAIWQTSNVRQQIREAYEMGDRNSFLIGDSGYDVEPWLLTPYRRVADGTPEFNFNQTLTRARNVVERTNGILKGRFRCLSKYT